MRNITHAFYHSLPSSRLEPHTTAVRVLAEKRSADQLLRLEAGHLNWDHTGAAHPEPSHHTRAANNRLRQLHLLRQQHRASKHLCLCIKRWESQIEGELSADLTAAANCHGSRAVRGGTGRACCTVQLHAICIMGLPRGQIEFLVILAFK